MRVSSLNIRNLLSSVGWKDGRLLVTPLILAAEGHKFFWPIDSTVTDTDNAGHSGPGSNANEELLYIPKSFWTEVLYSDAV